MIENSAKMGDYLQAGLRAIGSNIVKEIRGRGLMVAVELHHEAGGARRYCETLKDHGILCKETHTHTLRVMPPLVITQAQIDEALVEFKAVLTHAS
jgi:ornithine--oxo-acid transaminase